MLLHPHAAMRSRDQIMPFYRWKCVKCEEVIEELRKVGDFEPPNSCAACEECSCGGGQCEWVRQVTKANFKIDPAAG